jgi:hypothetical protein
MWDQMAGAQAGGGPQFDRDRIRRAFLSQGQEGLDQYRNMTQGGPRGPMPNGFDPGFYGGLGGAMDILRGRPSDAWMRPGGQGGYNDYLPNPTPPSGGMESAAMPGGGGRKYRKRFRQRDGIDGVAMRRGYLGGPGGPMGRPQPGTKPAPKPSGQISPDWMKGLGGPGQFGNARGQVPQGGWRQPTSWPGSGGPAAPPMEQMAMPSQPARPPGIYGVGPGGNSVSGGMQTYDAWQRPNQAQWFKRAHGTGPEAYQAWQAHQAGR